MALKMLSFSPFLYQGVRVTQRSPFVPAPSQGVIGPLSAFNARPLQASGGRPTP